MRFLLVAVLALSACKPVQECTVHVECGSGEACVDGQCERADCLTSNDCPIETYCDQDTFTCEPGCEFSEDCLTADRCNTTTQTCVPRQCQDTQRDCESGEYCNISTGECYLDTGPNCQPCSNSGQCGPEAECFGFTGSNTGYCLTQCNPEAVEACPASFQCTYASDGNHYCVSWCPFL